MCHLDVFTDTRIIYATLWRTGAKPHTRSTNKVLVRKRGGRGGKKRQTRNKRWKKVRCTRKKPDWPFTGDNGKEERRVDVKKQAYECGPRKAASIPYLKLSDFYHRSRFAADRRAKSSCHGHENNNVDLRLTSLRKLLNLVGMSLINRVTRARRSSILLMTKHIDTETICPASRCAISGNNFLVKRVNRMTILCSWLGDWSLWRCDWILSLA